MSIKYFLKCTSAGLIIGLTLVLALTLANMATDPETTGDVTPPPGIELMVIASHLNSLDLAWSDASGYRGGYDLISDATGTSVATFPSGQRTATIDGLTCGALYRFWLVGGGRSSNSVVGQTGPCVW